MEEPMHPTRSNRTTAGRFVPFCRLCGEVVFVVVVVVVVVAADDVFVVANDNKDNNDKEEKEQRQGESPLMVSCVCVCFGTACSLSFFFLKNDAVRLFFVSLSNSLCLSCIKRAFKKPVFQMAVISLASWGELCWFLDRFPSTRCKKKTHSVSCHLTVGFSVVIQYYYIYMS